MTLTGEFLVFVILCLVAGKLVGLPPFRNRRASTSEAWWVWYNRYLQSAEWKVKRKGVLLRACSGTHCSCPGCGINDKRRIGTNAVAMISLRSATTATKRSIRESDSSEYNTIQPIMEKPIVSLTVELTPDEVLFLRCCYGESSKEGHYHPGFDDIADFKAVRDSLIRKGVLMPERQNQDVSR